MRKTLTAALALLFLSTSVAEPVEDNERVPIDLRRTTLVVQDIDASLRFYRDALGMKVIYDRNIRTPRDAPSDEDAELARRLVFLRANDTYIGVLGLLQYTNPVKAPPHQGDIPFSTGSIVLLFNSEDVESAFEQARDVTGVRVISPPSLTEYPSYDGVGTIKVIVSALTDPDGFVIELNQLLTDPLQ